MDAHKKNSKFVHAIGGLVLVALGACGSEPPAASNPTPAEKQDAPRTSEATPTRSAAGVDGVLAAYERIRSELAADQVAATTESSSLLEKAASATASAGDPNQAQLQQLAASAQKLRDMPKTDANEVRKAFGDVSSAIVALVATDASLQAGRHIFECPMAQGYKKWVQTSEPVANPYMGSAMLECGSKSSWQ